MNRRDTSLMLVVALVWGLNFLAIDLGRGDVPPLLFLAVRFVLVVFPAVLVVPRPDVPWRTLALVGTFMSIGQFGFLYLSMSLGLPPGLAALVLQAQVMFTVVIAAVALRERPTPLQVGGVVLGGVGLVVVGVGRGGDVPLVALLLCLLGALSWGIGNVVSRAAKVPGGLGLTVWSGVVVPVPLLALSLLLDGPSGVADGLAAFGWEAWVSTLYTAALASLVGYGIFNSLLARNPAAAVVPWVLLVPPIAVTASWLLLGDVPTPGEAVGGLVVVLGALVAMKGGRPRVPESVDAGEETASPVGEECAAGREG
ncbi:EamA family transporter [Nocardioides sp. GY 10127]|uniref:EamA family transporter n=1 Tax=Nocardioides sp. GY 10127 TaxID=2569762 RepID=UPI0010A92318|nr:EamA family transporter [Nocardioides sp. GY 10127]TIC84028.1 EamA family transporter [Nocardioides sp. GY 10127]